MAEKYYAVKRGSKTGIFKTWDECKASVNGYSGAIYKSFKTQAEATAYLYGEADQNSTQLKMEGPERKKTIEKETDICAEESQKNSECVRIYVDGSYHAGTGEFSYGMVVLNGEEEEKYCQSFQDEELATMHNVAGEIKGAEAAMQYAVEHDIKEIAIYDKISSQVKVRFVKVTGHSNDKYNDMADELAKQALGIES